jgi:hypothetical protein
MHYKEGGVNYQANDMGLGRQAKDSRKETVDHTGNSSAEGSRVSIA